MKFLAPVSRRCLAAILATVLLSSGCASRRAQAPAIDPDIARAQIERLLPAGVTNRSGWAIDIFAALESLEIAPSPDNICAVVALTEQESTFQAHPPVPGLAAIARKEIDGRAATLGVPKLLVTAALNLQSPTGTTYNERLRKVKTEKELSDIFDDFVSMVPLGRRLLTGWNPVHTGGPMQVSIAFAEAHAGEKPYPYPKPGTIRDEVFTRRGGMYFGIAHLLDYPAPYDRMLFRFADFNAGHYASRNAAFQQAVNIAAKSSLALDGDLLRRGSSAHEPSNTELAVRRLAPRIEMSDAQIRADLERGHEAGFDRSRLYERVFALSEKTSGRKLARAEVPRIRLKSPKITRALTTEWFANRVEQRYQRCLTRAAAKQPK